MLKRYCANRPDHSFYGLNSEENSILHSIYTDASSHQLEAFFAATHETYNKFVEDTDRLETLLVWPYAAGHEVTQADLHVVTWFAHVLAGVSTKNAKDLSVLEARLQKSMSTFEIGHETKKLWSNYIGSPAFKVIFPVLH